MSDRLVQVAVDHPIDSELTYSVPGEMSGNVHVGSRVVVPLGRGNRLTNGTVLAWVDPGAAAEGTLAPLHGPAAPGPDAPPAELLFPDAAPVEAETTGIKPIREVLSEVHPVPADLIDLARWMAHYYCTPLGVTLATMVPAAVKKNVRIPTESWISAGWGPAAGASGSPDGGTVEAVRLSAKARSALAALVPLLADGPKKEADLTAAAGLARPALKRLAEKGLLRLERRIVWPDMEAVSPAAAATIGSPPSSPAPATPLVLTGEQETALAAITPLLGDKEHPAKFAVRLIYGVTGSGKTELYLRAIARVVAAGKRAIVLVPEISLTPQMVARFTTRFPRVAVLHSGLKGAQRHLHWHAIATGWAQVIVGARSAIFAPAADLGLIVVDEEHDGSYKQDNAPRYHGRDVAIRRAQMLNIPVLLGSATPALESWHNAHNNPHFGLLQLTVRPRGMQMPRVMTVDMRQQSRERRGLHILSTTLEQQLTQTLQQRKQAIFLLNRRGYAHYVMCPRCDWVLMCANCSTTMVVHRSPNALPLRPATPRPTPGGGRPADPPETHAGTAEFHARYTQVQCHYCLTAMTLPSLCPACQARLTYLGQGTQRAEDELLRKFPGLRIARMDSDTMHSADDYHRILSTFGRGEIDVLLGTQMIAKGLDFPGVALVGVLNSDLAMTVPDFRAAERTFQLICQVAGRSGRPADGSDGRRGLVVVQTFQPDEPAIRHACNHDYLGFVATELPHRKEFGYPPFGRMVRLLLAHKEYEKVRAEADKLMAGIRVLVEEQRLPIRWHDPQPPPLERLVEEYRFEIILFADGASPLQRVLASLRQRGLLMRSPVSIAIDVDPQSMM